MRYQNIIGLLFIFIAAAGTANAYVDATAVYNVPGVTVQAYNCANTDCSQVTQFGGEFLTGTSTELGQRTENNQITIRFPDSLQDHGYAIYHFKEGYLLWADKVTLHTYGNHVEASTSWQVMLTQKDVCTAVVDEMNVVNDAEVNKPLIIDTSASLSATTQSAFGLADHPVKHIPENLKQEYVGVDTQVELEIRDSYQNVRKRETVDFTAEQGNAILADESKSVRFSWTPDIADTYVARVTTRVVDSQCIESRDSSTSKQFTVLQEVPRNMCYTILNDLAASPKKPETGEEVTLTFTKLTNHADNQGVVRSAETEVTYTVVAPNGTEVMREQAQLNANPDAVGTQEYEFRFTPQQAGVYTITVDGKANDPDCDGLENEGEILTLLLPVKATQLYDLQFTLFDANTGDRVPQALVKLGSLEASTDSNGIVAFQDLAPGTYNYEISQANYHTLTGSVQVTDFDRSLVLPLVPGQDVEPEQHTATLLVQDAEGKVLPDATVRVNGVNALTDSLGKASFTLSEGEYDFLVSKEGYQAVQGKFTMAGADITVIIDLQELTIKQKKRASRAKGIYVDSVRMPQAYEARSGSSVDVRMTFENQGKEDYNAVATAYIPELGVRTTEGPFQLDTGDTTTRVLKLPIPDSAEPGYYWVRITVGEGKNTRVVHREVYVRNV